MTENDRLNKAAAGPRPKRSWTAPRARRLSAGSAEFGLKVQQDAEGFS